MDQYLRRLVLFTGDCGRPYISTCPQKLDRGAFKAADNPLDAIDEGFELQEQVNPAINTGKLSS